MFRMPSSLRFIAGTSKQIFSSSGKLLISSFVAYKRVKIKFCVQICVLDALRATKLM